MKKGKKILKSKTPKVCVTYIFLILGNLMIIPYFVIKFIDRSTINFLDLLVIFLGILFVIPGMMSFISYIIVYENGVKVRKSLSRVEIFSYFIPKFIPYEQIEAVIIEKGNSLSIQLVNDVYNVEISWILNYKDIMNEITQRISPTKIKQKDVILINKTKITLIKQNREFYGRYNSPLIWTFPEDGKMQITCYGLGTIQDPIIIDNSLNLPKRVSIKNYKLYFNFKSLQIVKLYLENCENFAFSNCEIGLIRMSSCSDITFIECNIPRDLKLKECQNVTFEKCLIRKTILFKSNDVSLKNCIIIRLTDWMSKNDAYELNKIKELRTNVKQEKFFKRNSMNKNEIKRNRFKVKKLFPRGFKVLITDKYFLISMNFIIFYSIGLFLLVDFKSKGHELGLLSFFPCLFFIFILMLFIMAVIDENYYKIKFRIMNKD
ncbi:MAG: hypothetical protein ACFFBH_00815 [Promethearchaeota archaeon]